MMLLGKAFMNTWTTMATRRLAEVENVDVRAHMTFEERRDEFWVQTVTMGRWYELIAHPTQIDLMTCGLRFRVVPAGRRSGKTERATRYLVEVACLNEAGLPDAWYVFAAPTRDQAKKIYWADLKAMVPKIYVKKISESELSVELYDGTLISVVGMDQPARIEGHPLDGIVLDEYGNMKPQVWAENVRPALSTKGRPGWAWLIGVPEGRNHYYRLALMSRNPEKTTWGYFHWHSSDILDPEEIADAKSGMDLLTYQQEYEGSFVNFEGKCYYPFDIDVHATERVLYDVRRPLILCFDFNVSPGTASIIQELPYDGQNPDVGEVVTAVIGEVYIPKNSNTRAICRKILADWGDHEGDVYCYGDASGAAKTTQAIQGSDWDIIRDELKPHFGPRLKMRVARVNPLERIRVNAVNTRLKTADDRVHLLVDPVNAPHVVEDFEGVTIKQGSAGEIDKDYDETLTHLTDGIGYYIEIRHPLRQILSSSTQS